MKGSEAKPHWARLHWPVIQVAVMDVVANALVTIGFFYVGSGVRLTLVVFAQIMDNGNTRNRLTSDATFLSLTLP